jgi:ABC-type nitrate/sulfonate/bicarbonate transport system substrate-binding protein
MRPFKTLLVAAALASLACGAQADQIRIGFAAESLDYAPAFAAERLGLFKKLNLDVKLIVFRGGAAAQEAMGAGAADIIAYFAPAVALAASKGVKERMVGTVSAGHVGWNAIVKADSPIKTIQDLAGKKVGISAKATTSDMAALFIAEKAGVKFQEIPLGAALVPGLRSGQVDAIVFSALITLREIDAGQARSIIDLTHDMPPTLADVYVASQEMIDKRPQELRAALGAIYEALAYMRQNREWTLAYLKDFAKSDNEKLNEQLYNHVIKELSPDGRIDKAWITNGLELAARAWDMPDLAKADPEALYSNDFHPAAK